MPDLQAFYQRVATSGGDSTAEKILIFFLLRPLAALYSFAMRIRAGLYFTGILEVRKLPLPVISVGNIAMGGTGKTPAVIYCAKKLVSLGKNPVVLTRGYGGELEGKTGVVSDGSRLLLSPLEAGDEPCLIARSVAGVAVVMGSDRYSAGSLAIEKLSPDCFILDDGYQHIQLHRDLDILLLDAEKPSANGFTIPAGMLREPVSSAGRADIAILTRSKKDSKRPVFLPESIPLIRSNHKLTGFAPFAGGEPLSFAAVSGKMAIAFSAIAKPYSFYDALEKGGVSVVSTLSFPDHSKYGKSEMEALGNLKQRFHAECLITTAKDAIKLEPFSEILGKFTYIAQMELEFEESGKLDEMLESLAARMV